MFGCNDNPSARHLESAWRKMLGHQQITASESSNCKDNDFSFLHILNASSRKYAERTQNEENENSNIPYDDEDNLSGLYFEEEVTDGSVPTYLDEYTFAYSAAILEKCIIEGRWYSPLKCEKCLRVFSEDEIVDDEFVTKKMKTSKLNAPARSTVQICKQTEISMKKFNYVPGKFMEIQEDILENLNIYQLYWLSEFDSHPESDAKIDHKLRLIKLIIKMYIKKKQDYLSKCNTLARHDDFIRHKLKKLVHFKGQ